MSEDNLSLIQTLPVPKVEKSPDGKCRMIWRLKFKSALISKALDTVVKEAKNPKVSFSYQMEGSSMVVEVGFPEGDYTTACDETFQLVRHLEERFGQVETIEGLPRTKWEMQFVISKHVRPKEGTS